MAAKTKSKTGSAETKVLRVTQLDSEELDEEIFSLLKKQFVKSFSLFGPGLLTRIEPEVNLALRYLIWKFSLLASNATLGQQLLDLHYCDESAASRATDSFIPWKKPTFALIYIGTKWLQERLLDFQSYARSKQYLVWISRLANFLEKAVKIAIFVNFLKFLQRGEYRSLIERLLGIRAQFIKPQQIRQVSFEYMNRELLWHGFSEFIFFVLPLINFRRLKNFLTPLLAVKTAAGPSLAGGQQSPAHFRECPVCGEWPTCPRQAGCPHAFCYYCLQSNLLSDPAFCCPSCGYQLQDIVQVGTSQLN